MLRFEVSYCHKLALWEFRHFGTYFFLVISKACLSMLEVVKLLSRRGWYFDDGRR